MATLSSEIRSHTGLRGLAAVLIMVMHYGHDLKPVVDVHAMTGFVGQAGVFVDLFFMLSGFIMMACYGDQFATRLTGPAVRDYWIKRFARIYPLHFLTLIWAAVFAARSEGLVVRDVIENLLLIEAWGISDKVTLNGVAWSISAEAFLYLCCPLFILILARRGGWALLGTLALACYLWLFLHGAGLAFDARLALLRAVPAFIIGLMLGAQRPYVARWSVPMVTAVQLVALGTLAVVMHLRIWEPLLIVCFAALILSTSDDRGPVARALAIPAVQWLGVMSYAIYMLHMPVRLVVYALAVRVMPGADPSFFALVLVSMCILGTMIAAPLIYHWFEMPARRWIVARSRARARSGGLVEA